ncbi:MAG: M48 family metalloprotease, partial [Thermoanaerobaculia bacterium]
QRLQVQHHQSSCPGGVVRARFVVLVFVLVAAVSAVAESYQEFDVRVERELHALDPGAVAMWQEANLARDEERLSDAIRLYAAVFERVPQFVHALRRQAGVELRAGNRAAALKHTRQAVELQRSSENLAALADALAASTDVEYPTVFDINEAKTLIAQAAQLKADDVYVQQVSARVGIAANDLDMLRNAVARLEAIDPKSPATHTLRAMVAASSGEWSEAHAALDRALALGLPKPAYDNMLAQFAKAQPFYVRWRKPVLLAVLIWFGVFALLLIAGAVLSQIALRAAREVRGDGHAAGLSGGVRRAYAAVLTLCCTFYYASIPIVMLLVLGIAGAQLYGIFVLGHIPVKLVALIAIIAGVSLWLMIKSLFIRIPDEDPGVRLDLAKEPKLRALLDDVAEQIGTRAVDNVYLTPGTDLAVMERGKGKKERCLILGVAALDGFALRPFKAVLGHEYGHFTNRDTAGGAYALRVRNSLHATAWALAQGGAAAWYSPAWLFVNGFHRVFMRISQGASRLQEVLADRWAVFAYGAEAFERGLRHVVERSVRFDAHASATLKEVVDRQVPLANLYTYTPANPTEGVAEAVEESLNRKASAYDSHPAPSERFELVRALPQRAHDVQPDDDAPVWSVFSDPHALQYAMTAQVRENVKANYGVEIAAPA